MTTVLTRTNLPATAKPKRRLRWLGRVAWGSIGVAAVLAIALASRPKPVHVEVAPVSRGDLVVTVEEVGKTRVRDRYVVAAPLAGNLLRIELRPGDTVAAAGILARIAPMESPLLDPRSKVTAVARSAATDAGERQARAAIARAEVASEHAEGELGRVQKLAATGSVPQDTLTRASLEARLRSEELTSARFAARMAVHEAAMARAALARFDVKLAAEGFDVPAPAGGTILRVLAPSAGPVQPGTPLLELGDPAALEIVTEILSADAVRVPAGATVTIERWGGPPLEAHVRRVEPAGFTRLSALGVEEQRVAVVVDLDAPRERWTSLGDGFRVEARIVVDERRAVLRAPLGAVFRHDGGWATYAVADGRARLVPVTLGARSDKEVEITSGITEGTAVVVHPSERVGDGVKVGR